MKAALRILILTAALAIEPSFSQAKKGVALGQDVQHFLESELTDVKNVRIHPSELGSKSWTIWISSEHSVIGVSNNDRKSLRFIINWWPGSRNEESEKTEIEFLEKVHIALAGAFKNIPKKIHISHSLMRKTENTQTYVTIHHLDGTSNTRVISDASPTALIRELKDDQVPIMLELEQDGDLVQREGLSVSNEEYAALLREHRSKDLMTFLYVNPESSSSRLEEVVSISRKEGVKVYQIGRIAESETSPQSQ